MEYAGEMSRRAPTGVTNDNSIIATDTELNCTAAMDKYVHTVIIVWGILMDYSNKL